MKKLIRKLSKRTIKVLCLLFLGYILFIGVLVVFAPKEELAKANWWVVTFVYWFFCGHMWIGIKMRPVFDGAVHILVEQSSKKF